MILGKGGFLSKTRSSVTGVSSNDVLLLCTRGAVDPVTGLVLAEVTARLLRCRPCGVLVRKRVRVTSLLSGV